MKIDNITDINDINLNSDLYCRTAWEIDKTVHFFAGATVSLAAATFVYAATPMLDLKAKIITAAVIICGVFTSICGVETLKYYNIMRG